MFSTGIHILRFYGRGNSFLYNFNIRTFSVVSLYLMLRFFRDLIVKKWDIHLNFLCNLLESVTKLDLEMQISSVPYCLEG